MQGRSEENKFAPPRVVFMHPGEGVKLTVLCVCVSIMSVCTYRYIMNQTLTSLEILFHMFIGFLAADLSSGLIHWGGDTLYDYYPESSFISNFGIHHFRPTNLLVCLYICASPDLFD